MSLVIYLNFLSTGKFVLIEYLTLNYNFAYFRNVIYLLYQLFIHACCEANFREECFFANFPPISNFQYEVSGWTYFCVWTRVAQTFGRLSDTSRHARSCRVLTWQWPSGRIPYNFKSAFSSLALHLSFCSLFLVILCVRLMLFHKFSSFFCPFVHFLFILGT